LDKVDGRLDKVEFELKEVKTDLHEVKRDVREMKENMSELFTKLDKFIALYEKQEQELIMFGAQLRRLEGRIAKLEQKQHLSK